MDLRTSFKILGLDPQADAVQAKRAYKAQVRRWHPDQFPERSTTKVYAEEQLKQINIAYARINAHLRIGRPEPSVSADAPSPHASQANVHQKGKHEDKPEKRAWYDHLFDALNTLAGNHAGKPTQTSAPAGRHKPFNQVLDEIVGGNRFSKPKRPTGNPTVAKGHSDSGYRRYRRRGSSVGAVDGTPNPGPVKPVIRVRGIGKNR